MSKILCSKSGITFQCEHFPIYLSQGETHHPIFDVPLKRLWKYFPKWQQGELTKTDSFLLFLSYLNSTELVEFRTHVWQRPDTDKIIASNMEYLFYTIGKIITIKHPKFSVPRFVVSNETRDLSNVHYWIKSWEESYHDFCNGLKDQELRSRLLRKESALERLIKNPALKPERYAHILADWASEAAAFPDFEMRDSQGNETTLSEYWKDIIMRCYKAESIISIPEKDLSELLAHCEENLDLGTVQSYHLFNTLREGLETLQGFFSIGSATFSILGSNDDVGIENLKLMVASAPLEMPKRTEYPSDFAFLRAKMKYQLATAATSNSNESSNTGEL